MFKNRRNLALALLLISASPLALALLAQYGFGLHPCELCLWQRVPLVALILVALLAWCAPRFAVALSAALWLIEAGLAAYHVGVEQHLWASATGCTAGGAAQTLEALRAQIMGAPLVFCDQPELVVLGLSMAGWIVLYSLCMIIFLRQIFARFGER